MLINVMYTDHRFDMIKADRLEGFIRRGEILKFKRSTGWVTVGIDPIRESSLANRSPVRKERRQIVQTVYPAQTAAQPSQHL
jgi:hypothetical protein